MAQYSRDAENQLDNQGEKAENEDEMIIDCAELKKFAKAEKDKKEYGYCSKPKARLDEVVEKRSSALLDRIVRYVQAVAFFADYSSAWGDKPSNYKHVLNTKVPWYDTNNKSEEDLIEAYNQYKAVAKWMLKYGYYIYGELCARLVRWDGRPDRVNTKVDINRSLQGRYCTEGKEPSPAIIQLFREQETKKLRIPKHPQEEQNSRDVSAFSFGENPL